MYKFVYLKVYKLKYLQMLETCFVQVRTIKKLLAKVDSKC